MVVQLLGVIYIAGVITHITLVCLSAVYFWRRLGHDYSYDPPKREPLGVRWHWILAVILGWPIFMLVCTAIGYLNLVFGKDVQPP